MNNTNFNCKPCTELQMTKGAIYPLQTRPPNRITVIKEFEEEYIPNDIMRVLEVMKDY